MHDATPTVVLLIGGSAIAYEDNADGTGPGEILETVEFDENGNPLWEHAGVADARGGGSQEGYQLLRAALDAAEANAKLLDYDRIRRVPRGVTA